MSRGVLIGKFMPPHQGHKYLIDFAAHFVDELTVQVCSIAAEPIPGILRYRWVKNSFGGVRVVHIDEELPQVPEECPDRFWEIWRRVILTHMQGQPDYLFASEPYGVRLAETIGAQFIPVDLSRTLVPISGTVIRQDPMRYWDHILPEAQPYFLKRIAIMGPESSGKTTLAAALAAHYQTRFVAEYARTYLDTVSPAWSAEAFVTILRGQHASEAALSVLSNRLLFCDTESITTALWAQILIGHVPEPVEAAIQEQHYALTLLNAPTKTWVEDPHHRFQPAWEARQQFFDDCRDRLEVLGRQYVVLSGDWSQREHQALSAIDALLSAEKQN